MSIIANRFKECRNKEGVSQKKLAELLCQNELKDLNYSESSIRQVIRKIEEEEKYYPPLHILKAYCKRYNTTSDYLLGIRDVSTTDEDIAMICKYTGLNQKSLDVLQALQLDDSLAKDNLPMRMDLLNFIFGYYLFDLLEHCRKYINTQYEVPVYFDDKTNKFVYPNNDSSKHKGIMGLKDIYRINLASSENNPQDHISIDISSVFLDEVYFMGIRKLFLLMKQQYNRTTNRSDIFADQHNKKVGNKDEEETDETS